MAFAVGDLVRCRRQPGVMLKVLVVQPSTFGTTTGYQCQPQSYSADVAHHRRLTSTRWYHEDDLNAA